MSPKNRDLPIVNLEAAEAYLLSEISSLKNSDFNGTVWVFICAAAIIEYLAALEKGSSPVLGSEYIDFIRRRFPPEYRNFQYKQRHRLSGTGIMHNRVWIAKKMTKSDLPEQMYYILRCGLVHGFSLVPGKKEIKNGGRQRSITINSTSDAIAQNEQHLNNFDQLPYVTDAAYFIDAVLIDHLHQVARELFADKTKHGKIRKLLRRRPLVWSF